MQWRGTRSCDGSVTWLEGGIWPLLAVRVKRFDPEKIHTKQCFGRFFPIVAVQSQGVSL